MATATHSICLLLLAAALGAMAAQELEWWKTAVIYQIFTVSFKDSDGDGFGDLKGITSKLDHLQSLNVRAVCLSPIYQSPMQDNGYDVSDFRGINARFGTMKDFENLLKQANDKGIKVILDFIPNHTSDEHQWFKAARDETHDNHDTYKDFYVWHAGKEGETEPNNWKNKYDGKTAWAWDNPRQMYYLHQFHEKQPDLNYRKAEVLKAIKAEMKFWLDKGVDGFRMDAVMCLVEAANFPDAGEEQTTLTEHQPESYDVIKEFRTFMDGYKDKPRVLITDAHGTLAQVLGYYGNAERPGAHFSLNFLLTEGLEARSTAANFVTVINSWIDEVNKQSLWSNWVIGNHDKSRVASRYSTELVDAMNMLVTMLPGTAVTYYGEEIGMEDNNDMTCTMAKDLKGCLDGATLGNSRNPERTPFQWDASKIAGFSTAKPWLPVHKNYEKLNAAAQKDDDSSHLNTYRRLVGLRSNHPAVQSGDTKIGSSGSVLAFSRSLGSVAHVVVVVNVGTEEQTVNLKETLPDINENDAFVVYAKSSASKKVQGMVLDVNAVTLSAKEALVLVRKQKAGDDTGTASRPISLAAIILTVAALVWVAGNPH